MKAVKYLFALWASLLMYVLLAVVFGPGGILAYRQLVNEQIKLEENINGLRLINRELEDTMNLLLYDRDYLALYAREQGYATEQERFIRIVGLALNHNTRISAGEVFFPARPQYTEGRILRIIAFSTGITILLCMALFDFLRYIRDRE